MSIRSNGEWSAPVNLGSEINTPGNELFPTFINGNLLSFSSNGQIENMGNLDIYYSVFPLTKTVHALPAPINSPNDDFGLKLHENKLVGYFVSNRNRNSSDDILMLEIKNLSRKFNGRIVDIDSNIPIANASVIFSYCTGGTINTVLTDNNGYFSNEIMSNECVEVEIISDGYEIKTGNITNFDSLDFKLKLKQFYEIHVFDSETNLPVENVQITNTENLNLQTNQQGMISIVPTLSENSFITLARDGYLIQELKPKPVGIRAITRDTVFMNKKQPGTVFFRKSIVENSEELKILEESTSVYEEIIKILELNPDLKVELGWHSDSRDTYSNNLRQTRNRSIFAVRYLENRGIEKNRVVGKGYGESQIINRCKNGVDCSEAEHSENRRIELKIIGFVEPDKENTEENSSEMINQQ